MSHQHHHGQTGKVLYWSLAATSAFVVLEAFAGFRSGSLALLSDAGHNFTDALALLLAAFGFYLQAKPADQVKTFGYQRAAVLAAFVNACTLVLLAGFILYESYIRLISPQVMHEGTMIGVAAIGLIVNLGIVLGLHGDHHHDLNIRAAWIHMLGDAVSTAGIIVGGVLIHYTGWLRVDPIISALIAIMIVWSAWDIIKESMNVLLEGLPRGVNLDTVVVEMRGVAGVLDVHDLHIWSLGSNAHALCCHVLIDDMPPSSSDGILKEITVVLAERFQIRHATVQFEHAPCVGAIAGCCTMLSQPVHRH